MVMRTGMSKPMGNVVAVVPEYCSGPGWSNAVVWVYQQDGNGKITRICLQPDEQPAALVALFAIGAVTHKAMITALNQRKKDA